MANTFDQIFIIGKYIKTAREKFWGNLDVKHHEGWQRPLDQQTILIIYRIFSMTAPKSWRQESVVRTIDPSQLSILDILPYPNAF